MPTDVEAASNRARDVAACEIASTIHVRSLRGEVRGQTDSGARRGEGTGFSKHAMRENLANLARGTREKAQ